MSSDISDFINLILVESVLLILRSFVVTQWTLCICISWLCIQRTPSKAKLAFSYFRVSKFGSLCAIRLGWYSICFHAFEFLNMFSNETIEMIFLTGFSGTVFDFLVVTFIFFSAGWISYLKFDINAIYAERSVVIVLVDAYLALLFNLLVL